MADQSSKRKSKTAPRVAIVGGGISGLTAALRLAERGYRVTVYEAKSRLGGNVGAVSEGGAHFDVYPHFFGGFYENFWDLAEGDLGLKRGDNGDFEAQNTFRMLEKGQFPKFINVLDAGPNANAWTNLFSGLTNPAEMFLWAYSSIDGLARSFAATDDETDEVSVSSFMLMRPYGTPTMTALHDMVLMTIWSVHGYRTSAAAYRRFLGLNMPLPRPLFWMLRGDLETKLIKPLRQKIESYGGVIETNSPVSEVVLDNSRIAALKIQKAKLQTLQLDAEAGDAVILAVPPKALSDLISRGSTRPRIVDRLPFLSEVRRLAGEPIPVLYLYFKSKLPNLPKEPVFLGGEAFDLSFIDLSQLWHNDAHMKRAGKERTVLCLASSDYFALPPNNPAESREAWRRETGFEMIQKLQQYLTSPSQAAFQAGQEWGDPKSDIDWDLTRLFDNLDTLLFANVVGGKKWQPETHYPEVPNLFFAGDCVLNPIRMATVESAVTSGLQAAREVWKQHPLGQEVPIAQPDWLRPELVLGLKAWMAPWACAAKCWCSAREILPALAQGDAKAVQQAAAVALADVCTTPYSMMAELWKNILDVAADYSTHTTAPQARGGASHDS